MEHKTLRNHTLCNYITSTSWKVQMKSNFLMEVTSMPSTMMKIVSMCLNSSTETDQKTTSSEDMRTKSSTSNGWKMTQALLLLEKIPKLHIGDCQMQSPSRMTNPWESSTLRCHLIKMKRIRTTKMANSWNKEQSLKFSNLDHTGFTNNHWLSSSLAKYSERMQRNRINHKK